MMDNHFKVRIQCMTYNHAPYIEDAMNGFCMQQTDFPFLAVVVDDASTDGEPEVIKHYLAEHFDNEALDLPTPDETDEYVRVFARHKENKNCYFLVMFLKYNHYSIKKAKLTSVADLLRPIPYIAMCEGDDYWTDPQKLQKQVDFLEEHPDYSLCCHRYKLFFQDSSQWADDYVNDLFEKCPDGFTFGHKETVKRLITHTATLMYRREMSGDEATKKYKYRKDVHLVYHLLLNGPGYFFSDICSVYRKHYGGVWTSLSEDKAIELYDLVYCELLDKNPDDVDLRDAYMKEVRELLYYHNLSKRTRSIIKVCLKSYLKNDGLGKFAFVLLKMLKTYIKGFEELKVVKQ